MTVSLNPHTSDHFSLDQLIAEGAAHHQAGRMKEAEYLYQKVIDASPENISALYRMGVLCFQDERSEEAIPFLEKALKLQPQNAHILNSLGIAFQNVGRDQESIAHFGRALEINSSDIGTLCNLAKALRDQHKIEEALIYFQKAAQLSPNNAQITIDIGRCFYEMEHFQEAISSFEKALKQTPGNPDALSALAATYWLMRRRDEARQKLEEALEIQPDDAKTILNLGEFLAFEEGKMDEACFYFDRALKIAPTYVHALWRKSFALLAQGKYEEGWRLYAECLGNRETRGFNKFAPLKPWNGDPDSQKHLLIWCEQGLGDSLQFIRYAELCKKRMGKVSVFCQKPLVKLFEALPFLDHVSDRCEHGSFDEHVPIMNLPSLFDTRLETIPPAPYLIVSPESAAKWRAKFEINPSFLKVGLVWAGGSHEHNLVAKITNLQRSIGLERMRPWLELPHIKFYSLQKDKPAEQIATLGLTKNLINYMGDVTDFADTAAIVASLDLVITVDTSIAHLAGGLGKPVWILSRHNADWRWLQNRATSPWYPTARIFGQPRVGDWDSVIADVGRALEAKAIDIRLSRS